MLVALFICTIATSSLLAQFDDVRAVGYLRDTSGIGGSVVSIDRDNITLRLDSGSLRELMLDNIRTLAVIERRSDIEAMSVAIFTYAGATLMNSVENRHGNFFIDDGLKATIGVVGGLLVGGLVGFAWGPREVDRRTEYSPADSVSRTALQEHVLASISPRPKWQLATHFGRVFGFVRTEVSTQLIDTGSNGVRTGGAFTLLRRIELARAISRFDLTANVVLLDQPSSQRSDLIIDVNDPQMRYYREIVEQYSGTGAFGGARYTHALGSNTVVLRGGLSVGVARSALTRTVRYLADPPERTAAASAAALGSLELILRLSGLALGISADYVAVPSMQVEESAAWDFPASTVNMSSGCIGFALGVEF